MGLQRFPVGEFRGGINYRDAPSELEANEAQDGLNITLAPLIGTLQQRLGKTRFDIGGLGLGPSDNLRPWYFGVASKLLMSSQGGSVFSSDVSGNFTLRFSGTAGSIWSFEQAQDSTGADRMWMMNGVDAPQRWDGVTAGTAAWANTPPNGTMLKVWRNRMCIAGVPGFPQRLFLSDIGNPESPAAAYGTQWVDIKSTSDDVDEITEIQIFENDLYVFKHNALWKVTNSNPPWDNQRVVGMGAEGRYQSTVARQKLYFFNRYGIWSVDINGTLDEESDSVSPMWTGRGTQVPPHTINFGALKAVRLTTSAHQRVLAAVPVDGSSTNNLLIEVIPNLNFRRLGGRHYILLPAICFHDFKVTAMCAFRPVNTEVVLAGTAAPGNRVHSLFTGTNDEGVAISSSWFTGWKGFITEEPKERFRRLNVELTGQVNIDVYEDFAAIPSFSGSVQSDADTSGDTVWDGGGTWDGGIWDPVNNTTLKRLRPETRGRYHALRFWNNTLDKSFTIFAAEAAIRGGKEH